MDNHPFTNLQSDNWNRKILNTYWISISLATLTAGINLFNTLINYMYYLYHPIIFPAVILTIIMLITEVSCMGNHKYKSYILITTSVLTFAIVQFMYAPLRETFDIIDYISFVTIMMVVCLITIVFDTFHGQTIWG